jgi:AraC-like DNA-binding protein
MIIGALVPGAEWRARVRDAAREPHQVAWCTHREELLPLLRGTWLDALVVEPWDAAGAEVAPVILQVRQEFPSLPIVAWCPLSPAAMHEVMLLTKAGVDDVLVREYDDVGTLLRGVLASARGRRTASEVLPMITPHVAPEVVPIIACCLEMAGRATSVEAVARRLGVHRKTLVNRMSVAGLPTPSAVIAWCRLLLAARLLEDPGRSVEHVALALEFGSGTALRNMLRRYTRLRPADVRAGGGLPRVLHLFLQALRVGPRSMPLAS